MSAFEGTPLPLSADIINGSPLSLISFSDTVTDMQNELRVCEFCGASVKRERYSVHVKKHLREEGKVRSRVIL